MEKENEIPLGLGFALAQDPAAMRRFSTLPASQMDACLQRARSVRSRGEMQALVDELGGGAEGR